MNDKLVKDDLVNKDLVQGDPTYDPFERMVGRMLDTIAIGSNKSKLRTSIGHHTFTLSRRILNEERNRAGYIRRDKTGSRYAEAVKLKRDIVRYFFKTGDIAIYVPVPNSKDWRPAKIETDEDGKRHIKDHPVWKITYVDPTKQGLYWILRYNNHSRQFSEYIIEARINPKVFVGIADYIRASDNSYLIEVEKKFNEEAKLISPLLGSYSLYIPKRIDFCVNFDLRELGINCTPEQMMQLIKRGDYPSYFTEFMYKCKKSKRLKKFKYSFYLKSGTVNINCYYKYKELQQRKRKNPDLDIEDALHIIRFEVQCLYRKTRLEMIHERQQIAAEKEYRIKKYMDDNPNSTRSDAFLADRSYDDPVRVIHRMLSDMSAERIIEKYFNQIIKQGDYYTLAEAIRMVEDEHFNATKEQIIIDTLKRINEVGIAATRSEIQPQAMGLFCKTLKVLADLNINPVTIPKSFKIKGKRIPNLLSQFKRLRDSGVLGNSVSGLYDDPYEALDEPYEMDLLNVLQDDPLSVDRNDQPFISQPSINQPDIADLLDDEVYGIED